MALFKNGQWAVRSWGLQSVKPGAPYEYNIAASRLLEKMGAGGGELYDWPYHMAEKNWVNIDAFIEAFGKALEEHKGKYNADVDTELLKLTYQKARERAQH